MITISDIYSDKNALEVDFLNAESGLLNSNDFINFCVSWLWQSRMDALRYDDSIKDLRKPLLRWVTQAKAYEFEFARMLELRAANNDAGGAVTTSTGKQTGNAKATSTNSNDSKSTTEVAANPSIDQVQAFDNLPYAQQQQRAKAEQTGESESETDTTIDTENETESKNTYGMIDYIADRYKTEYNEWYTRFNTNMRYIFVATI